MGYSEDSSMVRVDFFKPSGKWYTTEAVKFLSYHGDLHDAFKEALRNHFNGSGRLKDMTAICIEPYHKDSYPIQAKNW